MSKEPIEIYVPISVEDRLPDENSCVSLSKDNGKTFPYMAYLRFNSPEMGLTHWLEKQSKIILSQEEWDECETNKKRLEFYRKETEKVRELVSNSKEIGFPTQPIYEAIVDALNNKDKEIERLRNLIPIS